MAAEAGQTSSDGREGSLTMSGSAADAIVLASDSDTDEDEPAAEPPAVCHIICISDTHGEHDKAEVPAPPSAASVLVHCGDFESGSKLEEWLQRSPQSEYRYKLIVCGNTLDCCVHCTLRQANDMNYQTLLLADCCGCVEAEVPGLRAAMIASVGVEGGLFGTVCDSVELLKALDTVFRKQ